jgi:hypothetical protein
VKQAGLAVVALLSCASPALADSVIQFMLRERTVAVAKIPGPASAYKSDGDPDTVELVLIVRPEDGPPRFIEDGAVVFLREDMGEAAMQKLFHEALEARVAAFEKRLKAAETKPAQ